MLRFEERFRSHHPADGIRNDFHWLLWITVTTESSRSTTVSATRPVGRATDETVDRVLALRDRLAATDLRPGPAVDAAFGELVGLCCHPPEICTGTVLDRLAADLDALRALCAVGEGRMEEHWAGRIVAAADPRAELGRFPYLNNYHDLVRLELAALGAVGDPPPRRVVVLGSGPLPLTGLVLAQRHGAAVLHVDRDPGAVRAGNAVVAATGGGARVRSLVADLESPRLTPELAAELGRADLVLVGALVGADADTKAEITARLAGVVRPGARLLVRSAAGLRTVLYPPVTAEDLPGLEVLLEVHPRTDVVNSVLVARARR